MTDSTTHRIAASREHLIHALYEAAELEHNLMCTYLYAAFSLKSKDSEGITADQAATVERWRQAIVGVAIEEMGHLIAVWNITSALGAAPRFGRANFPLDIGYLPAAIVVKLAPFNPHTLQHFVFLERPDGSNEPDGEGFTVERNFTRGSSEVRLTPIAIDYATVGTFYQSIKDGLIKLVEQQGEAEVFRGDASLQIAGGLFGFNDIKPVICSKTALSAIEAIVTQGEGSQAESANSHYQRFVTVRSELSELIAANPDFKPSYPAATNPVLRRPPRPEGKVWLEESTAVAVVDLANACYGLMLRFLAYAYSLSSNRNADKSLVLDIGIGLMRAMALLGEQAARLPAGPSNPNCNAGVSFTALRDAASFPVSAAAEAFFVDRLRELETAANKLAENTLPRCERAAALIAQLTRQAESRLVATKVASSGSISSTISKDTPATNASSTTVSSTTPEIEVVTTKEMEIRFQAQRCIHARFCVTGAPNVFLANVKGPWIHPEAMPTDKLVEVAHACPSGAIQYSRFDGKPNESAPPVNLAAVREAGPYAIRGNLVLNGQPAGYRLTLCRCGASKHKPYCDGSHHDVGFSASGEPPSSTTDMLPVRDGPIDIQPETNGPLRIQGNLEITSGTGRVVARVESARLCRCGGSQTKPFCDGTHAKNGFKS